LLGGVCTRGCRFCNVATGRPGPPDPDEPHQVGDAVAALGLAHVVLTSVSRDDLADGGSAQFARAIEAVRHRSPETTVEVLTPDFRGDPACIDRVARAQPDVYNHNVETVPRLYGLVRPGALFRRSVDLLRRVKEHHPPPRTKSGLMLGLGETRGEVSDVLRELRSVGVDAVTLGQYLRPTLRHLPVERYLDPQEFEELQREAQELGFSYVASGPLVRSSFHADRALQRWRRAEGA
jgi:lipoic acid synthetase